MHHNLFSLRQHYLDQVKRYIPHFGMISAWVCSGPRKISIQFSDVILGSFDKFGKRTALKGLADNKLANLFGVMWLFIL